MLNILSFLSAAICLFCLALGIHILTLDPRKRLHQLCFITILCMSFLNAVGAFGFSASAKADFVVLFKIGCVGVMLIFPLMVHLTMEIVRVPKAAKGVLAAAFYLAGFYFIYHNVDLRLTYRDFLRVDGFWRFIKAGNTGLNLAFTFFSLTSFAVCVLLLIRWRIRSPLRREKKQALVLIVSAFLLFACLFAEQVVLRFFIEYDLGLSIIYFFVWPAGVACAVLRYRFLGITREDVAADVFENVGEMVIVLDNDLRIISANARAGDFKAERNGRLEALLPDFTSVEGTVLHVLSGAVNGFSATLPCRKKDDSIEHLALRFSMVKDKYGDILGILLIGRPVAGVRDFVRKHKLTAREFTVIRLLLTGATNREIAATLNLAESTIKTHVEHIYCKTGVNNKIELSNLVRAAGILS